MIKFFRHIRKSLLSENKFSKYLLYAIGEIILVVIGILIALQVNNKNELKKAKKHEIAYLEQLHEDFKQNKVVLDYFKKDYERTIKYMDATLKHTGISVTAPPAKVFDSIENINTPNVQLLYTTEASNAGMNLELLSNNNLKQFIKALTIVYDRYNLNEKALGTLILQQRKKHQEYIPLIAKEPRYSQEHFTADTIGLLRDKDFQNITVDRLWVTKSAVSELENVEHHIDSIISMLDKELKTIKQ